MTPRLQTCQKESRNLAIGMETTAVEHATSGGKGKCSPIKLAL